MNFRRNNSGSILPFLALGMPVIVAFLAFSLDLTRNITAVRKLEFATDAAALYVSSFATDASGAFNPLNTGNNMLAALSDVNNGIGTGSAWNNAPAGPVNDRSRWISDVIFSQADLALVPNPADSQEQLVQLTGRRDGDDALCQFFAPAITGFGALTGQPFLSNYQVNPHKTTEIVGQPVTRVGAGQPRNLSQNVRSLAPFAAFPIGLSNVQFLIASRGNPNVPLMYTADLISPNKTAPTGANHIQACLLNVGATGQGYAGGQGTAAINQWIAECQYFWAQPGPQSIPPAAVERGEALSALNPADPTFAAQSSNIYRTLQQVPVNSWLILPVLATNPNVVGANSVVGFCYAQYAGFTAPGASTNTPASILLRIGPTTTLRNVASDNFQTIPSFSGQTLPAPVAPFLPRSIDPITGGITVRAAGVALAPAISPRSANAS